MKILFAARHSGYLPRFATSLRELSARGHEIVIALGLRDKRAVEPAERLAAELAAVDGISVVDGVEQRKERDLGSELRAWMNHLRYLEPGIDMPLSPVHSRVAHFLPASLVEADLAATAADPAYPARQRAMLAEIEHRLPVPPTTREFVERIAPDVVVATPLIERREPQLAYLRAARELGIPRGVAIASWDNMTTSGLLHDVPDRVLVWNEAQRREAVELMGIPADRVVVTGAPGFDAWFGRRPSRDRAAFCAAAGLPDDRPYVLYLASSGFIAPQEARFITRWLDRIRESKDPLLRDANLIVRAHPFNPIAADVRLAARVAADARLVFHPAEPTIVVSDAAQADYFDALHHAAAVVGINTSGLIEATIVGTPVAVPLARRFRASQEQSLHFAHLIREADGLFEPRPLAPHLETLTELLDGEGADPARAARFVEAFVRPFGLAEPATPRVADAIEALAALPVEPHIAADAPDAATLAGLAVLLARTPRWDRRAEEDEETARQLPKGAGIAPAELRKILRSRVHIDQPLVLIGQVQRSGGTLLNSLLDGHPLVHSHPHELQIGHPTKDAWPVLDLTAEPSEWLQMLMETRLERMLDDGYTKGRREWHDAALPGYEPLPFLLPPSLLSSFFLELAEETRPTSARDVINLYLSAYFSAWLDGPGRRRPSARWVTAFCPRLGWEPNRSGFFRDYPDGRLLMVIREPRGWYASASAHQSLTSNVTGDYSDLDRAIALWSRNASEAEAAKRERPHQVFILTYEALVGRTDEAMRALADWLGIEWEPVLLQPTFDGQPISANSSFEPLPTGVRRETLDRWRSALADDVAADIATRASGIYERLRDASDVA